MAWLIRLFEKWGLVCRHRDVFIKTIQEQNLRGGYPHWSNIYKCQKCNRWRTDELPL